MGSTVNLMALLRLLWRLVLAVFLAWYLAALAGTVPGGVFILVSVVCVALAVSAIIWPDTVIYWLPASIMMFIQAPTAALACAGPAAALFACIALDRTAAEYDEDEPAATPDHDVAARRPAVTASFVFLFASLMLATVFGILCRFVLKEPAAWGELAHRLRSVPLLGWQDTYVGLRFAWVWTLALAVYLVMRHRLYQGTAGMTMLWSIQWATVPATVVGLCVVVMQWKGSVLQAIPDPVAALGGMLAACFILAGHLHVLQPDPRRKRLLKVFMGVHAVGIVLSGSAMNMAIVGLYSLLRARAVLKQLMPKRLVELATPALLTTCVAAVILCTVWLALPEHTRPTISSISGMRRLAALRPDPTQSLRENARRILPEGLRRTKAAAEMGAMEPLWGIGCGRFEQQYAQSHPLAGGAAPRSPCAYARLVAEGGVVTAATCALFLVVVVRRIRWCYLDATTSPIPECGVMARGIGLALGCVALGALTTDAWYANAGSILFGSVLAALLSCACDRLASESDPADDEPLWGSSDSLLARAHDAVYSLLMMLTWGLLPRLRLRWFAGVILLGALALAGAIETRRTCGRLMYEHTLAFGWADQDGLPGGWRSMHRHAALHMTIRQPVFSFAYRAADSAAAQRKGELEIQINEAFTARLILDTTNETRFYCDASSLSGCVTVVRFAATSASMEDNEDSAGSAAPTGVLLTPVTWQTEAPTALVTRVTGVWNNRWTLYPGAYEKLGFALSNRTFRVTAL